MRLNQTINNNKTDSLVMKFNIEKTSDSVLTSARHKIDMKTKPRGSLGRLEDLAIQMSRVQNTLFPAIERKAAFVFAADHGVVEEGVSAFPQEVTQQMVLNFLSNGAAINVLCAHNNIDISIIDVGIKGDMAGHDKLISKKVAHGTRNFARTMAMTREEAEAAINVGASVFEKQNKAGKIDVLAIGEMGIGNTTAATAIISAATGFTVEQCAGRGTGVDDEAFKHKIEVIEKALKFHQPARTDAMDILCKVGGFEIAAMAGAALKAASNGSAVVLDGVISTSAGIIAYLINPVVADYFIAGHKSVEIGQKAALEMLNLKPVLDLDFRLGEGTGAALAINIVEASCKIMCEMATFEEANVSGIEK